MNPEIWWADRLEDLQARIGHLFSDKKLLEEALTHASFRNESGLPFDNERLEFLGDAVLELCASRLLFEAYPASSEGELTQMRSGLVREATLARRARDLRLDELLRMGRGLRRDGGAGSPAVLSDVLEAVLGAVFLDGGFDAAMSIVEDLFDVTNLSATLDPKSELQTLLQKTGRACPAYRVVAEDEEAPERRFKVQVSSGGRVLGEGSGPTIKAAGFAAASDALEKPEKWS